MGLRLLTPPAVESVTVAEQKTFMRVDIATDDALIALFITAARQAVEVLTGRAFITQKWQASFDVVPIGKRLELPIAPVISVESVKVADVADTLRVLDASEYTVDTLAEPARITLNTYSRPSHWRHRINAAEVVFTCGYGAAATDVPEGLRQAVRFLASHFYENRTPVGDASNTHYEELPMGVQYLLAPYRLWGRQL